MQRTFDIHLIHLSVVLLDYFVRWRFQLFRNRPIKILCKDKKDTAGNSCDVECKDLRQGLIRAWKPVTMFKIHEPIDLRVGSKSGTYVVQWLLVSRAVTKTMYNIRRAYAIARGAWLGIIKPNHVHALIILISFVIICFRLFISLLDQPKRNRSLCSDPAITSARYVNRYSYMRSLK